MLASDQIEALIGMLASLDRGSLIQQFDNYRGNFPLDFTPEFLKTASLDRLRHIFLALCLQNQRLPQMAAELPLQAVA